MEDERERERERESKKHLAFFLPLLPSSKHFLLLLLLLMLREYRAKTELDLKWDFVFSISFLGPHQSLVINMDGTLFRFFCRLSRISTQRETTVVPMCVCLYLDVDVCSSLFYRLDRNSKKGRDVHPSIAEWVWDGRREKRKHKKHQRTDQILPLPEERIILVCSRIRLPLFRAEIFPSLPRR